jgi:hypothetical protein
LSLGPVKSDSGLEKDKRHSAAVKWSSKEGEDDIEVEVGGGLMEAPQKSENGEAHERSEKMDLVCFHTEQQQKESESKERPKRIFKNWASKVR